VFLAESTQFCSVNFTSSHLALLADTDYLTVRCSFSYFAASHWIPHVQCLPNIAGQTEETNETSQDITYTKSFNATPDANNVVINCTAKFNYTSSDEAYNAPTDVNLWQSPSLHVQCRHKNTWHDVLVCLNYSYSRFKLVSHQGVIQPACNLHCDHDRVYGVDAIVF